MRLIVNLKLTIKFLLIHKAISTRKLYFLQ
jgi:hypothetical protein